MKDESENKINNDLVSFSPKNDSPKIKRKRKIKKKKSTNITNFIKPESEETKSKKVFKNNIKDENEVIRNSNDNDFDEKAIKETEKTQRKKITKVKFNCVDLYICFLCTRKRKKVENILIDEGMNLFTEKLDVINIFSKLLKLENFEKINKDAKPLGMSDECKIRLEKMKYPKDLT